jgi:hypothetical protein
LRAPRAALQLAVVPRDGGAWPPPVGLLEAEAVGSACAVELTQRALRRATSPPSAGKSSGGGGGGGGVSPAPAFSAAAASDDGAAGGGAGAAARRLFSDFAACDAL